MSLTVLAHDPLERDPVSRGLYLTAEAARQAGLDVVSLPWPLTKEVVASLKEHESSPRSRAVFSVFSGYRPTSACYRALHSRYPLLNTPEQSAEAMEFDLYYPLLADLTAKSRVVRSATEAKEAVEALGLPLFMKGLVKSDKEQGLQVCLAQGADDLVRRLARGPVVARQLLALRRLDGPWAFPRTREYRFYLFAGHLLGHGYYWLGDDPFGSLSKDDVDQLGLLAQEAAGRVSAPLVAVDVGQLDSGEWALIEIGDPQFSGVAHMPRHLYWRRLAGLSRHLD